MYAATDELHWQYETHGLKDVYPKACFKHIDHSSAFYRSISSGNMRPVHLLIHPQRSCSCERVACISTLREDVADSEAKAGTPYLAEAFDRRGIASLHITEPDRAGGVELSGAFRAQIQDVLTGSLAKDTPRLKRKRRSRKASRRMTGRRSAGGGEGNTS